MCDLELGVFLISRDVVFCENEFAYVDLQPLTPGHANIEPSSLAPWSRDHDDHEMEIARSDSKNRTSAETTGDLENNESVVSL